MSHGPIQIQRDNVDVYPPAPNEVPPWYVQSDAPRRSDWRVVLVICAFVFGTIAAGGMLLWYIITNPYPTPAEWVVRAILLILAAIVLYGVAVAVAGWARRPWLVRQPGGLVLTMPQVAALDAQALLDRQLDAQVAYASRQFPHLSGSLTLTNSQPKGMAAIEPPPALALAAHQPLPADLWKAALDDSPHLLIYGPSKAGKSTIAQAYVSTIAGAEYVVIDPMPNKPDETKWGGADFVTLGSGGGDEFGPIKAALKRITDEDDRRRRAMKDERFVPLIVIIDEVLGLVDALGLTRNEQGKQEPVLTGFIRRMGYSARHRNIKIILIGQGKNLDDLALKSGTARNNYALIRAERNAATNERSSYIVTPEGEQAMDVREVVSLSQRTTTTARLWLAHADVAQPARAMSRQDVRNTLRQQLLTMPNEKRISVVKHLAVRRVGGKWEWSTDDLQWISGLRNETVCDVARAARTGA